MGVVAALTAERELLINVTSAWLARLIHDEFKLAEAEEKWVEFGLQPVKKLVWQGVNGKHQLTIQLENDEVKLSAKSKVGKRHIHHGYPTLIKTSKRQIEDRELFENLREYVEAFLEIDPDLKK